MSKRRCQYPGTAREKNNSFSSFLFSVNILDLGNFKFFLNNKNPQPQDLHLYVIRIKLIIEFGVQKGFFPTDLIHRAYSFQLFLFSSTGHGSSLGHKRSTLEMKTPDTAETPTYPARYLKNDILLTLLLF